MFEPTTQEDICIRCGSKMDRKRMEVGGVVLAEEAPYCERCIKQGIFEITRFVKRPYQEPIWRPEP